MSRVPLGKARLAIAWNVTMAIAIALFFVWRALRAGEYNRLADHLGYSGPPETFPIAYFREVAPKGALPQEVWSRMRGYSKVSYFLVPIAGLSDSVLVQRFTYSMNWDDLQVDIEYKEAVVRDIETGDEGNFGAKSILPSEAYRRLNWKPPE